MNQKELVLGIELGSTRIKGVLLDRDNNIVCQGFYDWENEYDNGIWTYSLAAIYQGIQNCYKNLKDNYKDKFGETLSELGCIGISAMMHGYLAFDDKDNLLVPFRTWRNTITGEAAEKLSKEFHFNIPQRWSIAHLYQAMLNKEEHLSKLSYITTLAGFIHYRLTGVRAVGIGEASGIFPIDSEKLNYDETMLDRFDELNDYSFRIRNVLPKVLLAGEDAGCLTKEGALFLDPEGDLNEGIPLCPAEGDAGTGMVATDSIKVNTGNVSAGTSDFAMIVTDKKLGVHREIDMVTTPMGLPVAMVHCNNCTSDINAWVNLLSEAIELTGAKIDKGELFTKLFTKSLEGDKDCGGLLSYNYFSGEGVTDFNEGRPFVARTPNANFSLANFMKMNIMSAFATLKIGLDILTKEEKISVGKIYGHGGIFKTPVVGQKMLSAAVGAPVSVMESAGEGGSYGMALLANYYLHKNEYKNLEDYLDGKVFRDVKSSTVMASQEDIDGFNRYIEVYKAAMDMERAAIRAMKAGE